MANGSKNRRRGHNYERQLVKELRALDPAFQFAQTARYASKASDDAKIDIVNVPINIQAKNVKGSINYIELIKEIKKAIENSFLSDSVKEQPVAVFHKKGRGKGSEIVVLSKEDFYKLISSYNHE